MVVEYIELGTVTAELFLSSQRSKRDLHDPCHGSS